MATSETDVVRGDAFESLAKLDPDFAQAAILDYPWTFENQDRPGAASVDHVDDWEMADNGRIHEALSLISDAVESGGWVFVFADDDVYPEFRSAVEEALTYRKTLIWDTEYIGMGHYFRSRHTPILAATVGETDRYVQETPTVYQSPAPQRTPGYNAEYPTEKPVDVMKWLLEEPTDRGDRVIEPFCGTAPSLGAAKTLGLDYWGADVSPRAIERAGERESQTTAADFC